MRAESRRLSNKKRELRFIITDPSSDQGRVDSIREIRSHAGHWRWDKERESRHKEGPGDSDTADTSAVSTKSGGRIIAFDDEEEEEIKRSDGLFTSPGPSLRASPVATMAAGPNFQASSETGSLVTGNAVTFASYASPAKSSHMASNQSASYHDPPGIAKSIGADNLDPFQTFLPSSLPQQVVSTALKYCIINLLPYYDRADFFF